MQNILPNNGRNKMSSYSFTPTNNYNDNKLSSRNIPNSNFRIDVREEKDSYLVEAELPGVDKEYIHLELNGGQLLIGFEQKSEINNTNNYIYRERLYSSTQRSIYLGNVKLDGITANLDNGVLTIRVLKDERTDKLNKIEIQ